MALLALAHQAEGMSVAQLERRSAAKTGKSVEEWRKAVLGKLEAGSGSMKNAAQFLKDRNWTGANPAQPADTNAFADLIKAQSYNSPTKTQPSSLSMLKYLGKDLVYDTGWQPKTSVSYVLRYTGDDKRKGAIPAGNQIGDVKYKEYVNPEEQPGIVARDGVDANLGSFVRVGDANNPLRYARVIDAKPDGSRKAEINIATGHNLGNYGFDPNEHPAAGVDVEVVGPNPQKYERTTIKNGVKVTEKTGAEMTLDTKLDNEHTQYAGYLSDAKNEPYANVSTKSALDKTMEKYKNDPAFQQYKKDVQEALKKQKKALEDALQKKLQKGGGDRVEKGVQGVLAGKDKRQIVTVTAPTQSGDELAEGRWGTYAGLDRLPVSTLGSLTIRGNSVVTALEDVEVFGSPTSAPA